MNLVQATREVRANGPKRVVIGSGETTGAVRAKTEHGIEPNVVFLRDDGWTLGASAGFRNVAQSMWAGSWIAVMENYPEGEFKAL